jgi:hypothetical protein
LKPRYRVPYIREPSSSPQCSRSIRQDPVISITLDEHGGQARCALAVRDRHVQSATAAGEFGRATCAGALPAEEDGPRG